MAKKIMFVGTGSSVGKSLIAAAMCRIFNNEGYNVAPFKSQNMALNSYITDEGMEMGRAQVVQAEAARIKPHVNMNPILLKPTSDVGSQVILKGKVYSNMKAQEYYKKKNDFKKVIMDSFEKLEEENDIIIIEGAGSPAEINLSKDDIVNMGLSQMVDSDVILIGDIDKGGVFASIYGTIMLLEEEQRKRVKGFLINKFRGDLEILKPGLKMLEDLVNIPCIGVVPYGDFQIDDEDSVTKRFTKESQGNIIVGVVKLPYISNFTDFSSLEIEEDVAVRYITNPGELYDVDIIIIPGSKNTINDMKYLHERGFDKVIYKKRKEKTLIIGVCGGYQILGQEIKDPFSVESGSSSVNGLNLLNVKTVMKEEKTTVKIKGKVLSNIKIDYLYGEENVLGYEIHMGISEFNEDVKPFIKLDDGRYDGAVSNDGKVIGTYLHGIFDNDDFRKRLLNYIRKEKGLDTIDTNLSFSELKDKEYEKLAKTVKDNIDLELIKKIMGL